MSLDGEFNSISLGTTDLLTKIDPLGRHEAAVAAVAAALSKGVVVAVGLQANYINTPIIKMVIIIR